MSPETFGDRRTRAILTDWPDTSGEEPPRDHAYRSATWLLGRHPRLAQLATRIDGVIYVDGDGELSVDVDHLGDVFAAGVTYGDAWDEYEYRSRPPQDENAYDGWQQAGPQGRRLCQRAVRSAPDVQWGSRHPAVARHPRPDPRAVQTQRPAQPRRGRGAPPRRLVRRHPGRVAGWMAGA
jgi:hypothetical protein